MCTKFQHWRMSFAAVACGIFLTWGSRGIAASDNAKAKLTKPRLVDAPLTGGSAWLAFSPDGKRVAIGGTGEREMLVDQQRVKRLAAAAYLCDAGTGKQIALLGLADQPNYGGYRQIDLAFSPDGKSLATCSAGTVQLWDAKTGREQTTLKKATVDYVAGHIAYSPSGRLLAIWLDQALELWDVAARKKIRTIPVTSAAVSAFLDDETLLTAEYYNRVHLWRVADGAQLGELHPQMGILYAAEISPDRKLAAIAGGGFKLLEISAAAPRLRERNKLRGQLGEMGSVSFSKKQDLLATAGLEGTVRLWDPQNGKLLGLLKWPGASSAAAALSPDGQFVAVSRSLSAVTDRHRSRITEIYPVAAFARAQGD